MADVSQSERSDFLTPEHTETERRAHLLQARNARIEAAARKVVEVVASDAVTPKAWAFDTPSPIREAIIELEDVLDDRR